MRAVIVTTMLVLGLAACSSHTERTVVEPERTIVQPPPPPRYRHRAGAVDHHRLPARRDLLTGRNTRPAEIGCLRKRPIVLRERKRRPTAPPDILFPGSSLPRKAPGPSVALAPVRTESAGAPRVTMSRLAAGVAFYVFRRDPGRRLDGDHVGLWSGLRSAGRRPAPPLRRRGSAARRHHHRHQLFADAGRQSAGDARRQTGRRPGRGAVERAVRGVFDDNGAQRRL